jgi:ribosome-associated heat shock protein Hsp15
MSDETAARSGQEAGLRLDKWLWYARFFKSRSLASKVCARGKLRLGGAVVSKAHQIVRPGDVLTFPQGRHIRLVRVLALASRRGPASEAAGLYEDLKPPAPDNRLPARGSALQAGAGGLRPQGSGRPTKRDRRAIGRLRGS